VIKLSIEGDDAQVYGLLYALGLHSSLVMGPQQAPAPAPAAAAGTVMGISNGFAFAAEIVEQWQVGWGSDGDQPDRASLLSELPAEPVRFTALRAFLASTDEPWVRAGATPEQAAHIIQVGSALQIIPAPS